MKSVKCESGTGPSRTLHRNMSLLLNFIPVEVPIVKSNQNVHSRKPRIPAHSSPESISSTDSETETEHCPVDNHRYMVDLSVIPVMGEAQLDPILTL